MSGYKSVSNYYYFIEVFIVLVLIFMSIGYLILSKSRKNIDLKNKILKIILIVSIVLSLTLVVILKDKLVIHKVVYGDIVKQFNYSYPTCKIKNVENYKDYTFVTCIYENEEITYKCEWYHKKWFIRKLKYTKYNFDDFTIYTSFVKNLDAYYIQISKNKEDNKLMNIVDSNNYKIGNCKITKLNGYNYSHCSIVLDKKDMNNHLLVDKIKINLNNFK